MALSRDGAQGPSDAAADAPTLQKRSIRASERAMPVRIGSHEVLGEIARGGMGVVYRARQAALKRDVAIKMIRDSWFATEVERRRFQVEAQAVAALRHPGIVTIHEIGEHEGLPYFTMELVEGPSLREAVEKAGPFEPRHAAHLLRDLADAVAHAHAHGVVHRDLKPANVLLAEGVRPKIADFGIARDRNSAVASTGGEVVGTPGWMAPEQAMGIDVDIGPATDVHGLGAILYHLLTGVAPFEGESEAALVLRVIDAAPLAPRLVRKGIPRDLEAICLRCLAKRPADRYASADELGRDLARFLAGEPVAARPRDPVSVVRRWFMARPALGITWLALGVFMLTEEIVLAWLPDPDQAEFHHRVKIIVGAWAVAAGLMQAWLSRSRSPGMVHATWAMLNLLLLTLLIVVGDGPRSALVACYPLLVLSTAFVLRPWLVVLTTTASIAGYVATFVHALVARPDVVVPGQDVLVHSVALAVLGMMTTLIVRRLRGLAGLADRPAARPAEPGRG